MQPQLNLPANLLDLGDLSFTVPSAIAIAAALWAGRSPRRAWRWSLLFGTGMLLVGLSKITFMAWGVGIEPLAFKALSGHAAGATAVLPLLIYLTSLFLLSLYRPVPACRGRDKLDRQRERALRQAVSRASLLTGLGLGVLVAYQLVIHCEHSISEALAGCAIGAAVSVTAFARSRPPACLRPAATAACFGAAFLLSIYLMNHMHVGYWMIKAARLLNSGQLLHSLSIDSTFHYVP